MKLLTFLLAFLIPLSLPIDDNRSSFYEQVDNGYSYYQDNYINISNNYYDLLVVKGIYNNNPSYGICYTSIDPGKYFIALEVDGVYYSFKCQDSRNDVVAVAIRASSDIKIHIYDEKNNEFNLNGNLLKSFEVSSLDVATMLSGSGNGTKFSQLTKLSNEIPFFEVFLIVTSSVIGMCTIIIVLMLLLRKGMFNKDKRRAGIVNIKEILNEQTDDLKQDENSFWEGYEHLDKTEVKEDKPVDDVPNVNIKEYLQSLGYVTTYKVLSEEEKNKIMLELMKLKDTGKISLKQYYEETGELWKK